MLKYIAAAISLLFLSGCWENKDINHRALPIAMGISYNKGSYTIYLDIPRVSAQDQGSQVITAQGDSINEVIDRISMNMERQVDLLHMKVIIVDKAYAVHGLKDGVESIIRSRHIAPKTMVVVCDEPLDHFFEQISKNSESNGTEIYDFFQKNAGWSPEIAYTQTWRIFRSIHSYTNDVVLPSIKSGDTTVIKSTGSAIMRNGKMVGRLNNEQTLLYNIFNGVSTEGRIEVMGHATVQIVSSRIQNNSFFKDQIPQLKTNINLKVIILDTLGNPSTDEIKSELHALVSKRFEEMFKIIQKADADIFGLGQHFRNDLSRSQLTEWRTVYLPKLKIDLTVNTIIRNTGNLKSAK